jgi:UDP-N-acetylmuramoyl-tripeptide--D-alanyl-D-alanine ligase
LRQLLKRAHRAALYATACVWRTLMFRTTFIAITGSVGKTTAKEALAATLESRGRLVKTDVSRNELTYLIRKVLSVRPWHRYAVLEVATDGPGWMKRMAWLARPDIAVILRVARTHSNRFRTLEATAEEKAVLLSTLRRGGIAVLNADDERVAAMAAKTSRRVVRFGSSVEFDVWADEVTCEFPAPLAFRVHTGSESCAVRSQLVGTHWTTSIVAAMTVARLLGVPMDEAAAAISRMQPVQGRMQPVLTPSGAVILRDDENGSVATVDGAFEAFQKARATRKIVVISDVADDPTKQRQRASRLGRQVAAMAAVGVFVGDHSEFAVKGAVGAGLASAHGFVSLREASEFLRRELRSGDLVLLKGRASDHVSRLAFAQFGEIGCWVEGCAKNVECDDCEELRASGLPPRAFEMSAAALAEL